MSRKLLSIVEMGGYEDYSDLYAQKGFKVETKNSMRKAIKTLKKDHPEVVVAEFNFQSDFRDRTSSLESLMATLQSEGFSKVIVFYEKDQRAQLERLLINFEVYKIMPFPIDVNILSDSLDEIIQESK